MRKLLLFLFLHVKETFEFLPSSKNSFRWARPAEPYTANYLNVAVGLPVGNFLRIVLEKMGSLIYVGNIIYSDHYIKLNIDLKIWKLCERGSLKWKNS